MIWLKVFLLVASMALPFIIGFTIGGNGGAILVLFGPMLGLMVAVVIVDLLEIFYDK